MLIYNQTRNGNEKINTHCAAQALEKADPAAPSWHQLSVKGCKSQHRMH